jgi:hypothetical protein
LVEWGKYEQNRFLLKLRDVKANKQTI